MTDDDTEEGGVPDSDPRHIDPAGDIADAVESGAFNIQMAEEQSEEELREFVRKAEAGEFDLRADPGLEATVRIARAILEQSDDRDAVDDEDTDG
jgi:hypothetical protein